MVYLTTTERRVDFATRQEVDNILDSFAPKEAKVYWLNKLVKQGKIPAARAGQIIIEKGLA